MTVEQIAPVINQTQIGLQLPDRLMYILATTVVDKIVEAEV